MRKILPLIPLLFLCYTSANAQSYGDSIQQQNRLIVRRSNTSIQIDGELSETAWQLADSASNFWMKWPKDNLKAQKQSQVKILFDDNYLYIAAKLDDTSIHIIQTLKRDTRYWDSDGFGIVIDPVNQHTNGFFFGVSPYNVQAEDLLAPFGTEMNFSWDNKWFSATSRQENSWTLEIAIPFKTLRYQAGKKEWGINFVRNQLSVYEFHSWTHIPINFNGTNLNYTGLLVWEEPPPNPGSNISFIPYVSASVSEDKENNVAIKAKPNAGFDAKVAVSSSMNLDLTVNPDFSQVEVDRQVTNLTRFNLFFPERRTFFLENDDLFSSYGSMSIRPFYSRRIGLDENGNVIPILFGARLSGNLSKNVRLGVMSMQTEGKNGTPPQNYTAVSMHHKVLERSSVRTYFLNRQSFMSEEEKKLAPFNQYGRNAGAEFVYSDKSGEWNGWSGFHLSFKPGLTSENIFWNAGAGYFGRKIQALVDYIDVGTNYYTDMGFSERLENYDAIRDTTFHLGTKILTIPFDFFIYPNAGKISFHDFGFDTRISLNPDGSLSERVNSLRYQMQLRSTESVSLKFDNSDVRLLFPVSFTEGVPLPVGKYNFNQISVEAESDNRKKFVFGAALKAGTFYNGNLLQFLVSIAYRKQPWGNFSIEFEQNSLKFPDPYGSDNLFLISPRIEINFSNKMFWTTFLQFNTQKNNFNINSRFQWRYKPMSDIFLVYTDNYFTDPLFKNKNRALVFKMNYWLNL